MEVYKAAEVVIVGGVSKSSRKAQLGEEVHDDSPEAGSLMKLKDAEAAAAAAAEVEAEVVEVAVLSEFTVKSGEISLPLGF